MSELESKKKTDQAEKLQDNHADKGDQDHSLEIIGFGATVSRKTKLTEKDLAKDLTKCAAKDAAMEGASPKEASVLKGTVEENALTPQAVLERIASLARFLKD